jgi:hypothetical protein
MKIGDLVRSTTYGMVGIIIGDSWIGSDGQTYDFGILYNCGKTYGTSIDFLEEIKDYE